MHHYLEEGKASGAPKFGTNLPTSVHPTDKQYSITQFTTVFSIAKRLEEVCPANNNYMNVALHI